MEADTLFFMRTFSGQSDSFIISYLAGMDKHCWSDINRSNAIKALAALKDLTYSPADEDGIHKGN